MSTIKPEVGKPDSTWLGRRVVVCDGNPCEGTVVDLAYDSYQQCTRVKVKFDGLFQRSEWVYYFSVLRLGSGMVVQP